MIDGSQANRELIGRRLAITAQRFREWTDREMAGVGGGLVGWLVLKHATLAEAPGLSQRELAKQLSIGGPAMVRHLDRLAADGLIERQADATDRRVTRVVVTAAGIDRQDELAKIAASIDEEIRSILTERQAAVLLKALARVEQHIISAHPQRGSDNS